jgi:pyridoxal biosynthesis lyase PdxS
MRPSGSYKLKKLKEEETIAEKVKKDMYAAIGGQGGGVGGAHMLGTALKELVGIAQTTMLLSFGGQGDQQSASGLREEMMKAAMLKLQSENLDTELMIQRKQMAVNDLATQIAKSTALPVTPTATGWTTPAATRNTSLDNNETVLNPELFDSDSE